MVCATVVNGQTVTGDPTFGANGVVNLDFPDYSTSADPTCVIPLANKQILTGSLAVINFSHPFGSRLHFKVVRLKPNGSYDETFGKEGGFTSIDLSAGTRSIRTSIHGQRLAVQADGKIVGTAYAYNQAQNMTELLVFRLTANGIPDSSFGTNSQVKILLGNTETYGDCITVLKNGKIAVGGRYFTGTSFGQAIVRLLPSGVRDSSFNGNGAKGFRIGDTNESVKSIAEQPDGKLVLGSSCFLGSNYDMVVARLNTNGDLDNSFNGVGWTWVPFGINDDLLEDIALQDDNKIVMAGWTNIGSMQVWAIARLNANGAIDNTFDADGRNTVDFNGSTLNHGYSVVVQKDGKLVMSGETHQTGANYEMALCRFKPNGSIDSTFNVNGRKIFSVINSLVDNSTDLAIAADGKLVLGGVIQGRPGVLQTNVVAPTTNTGPDCNTINVQASGQQFKISGVAAAPIVAVHVFNSSWATVYNQTFTNLPDNILVPLPVGTYHIKVSFYTASWSPICEKIIDAAIAADPCPQGAICITNTCPQQTVDLNSAYSMPNLPAGATVSWHTGSPATAANKLTASQAQNISVSGNYYAAINITGSECYSSTVKVVVTINNCATGSAAPSAPQGTAVAEPPVTGNNVIIAPNPFISFVIVNINSNKAGRGNISLVDISGRLIMTRAVQLHRGNNRLSLDGLDKYPSGSYFLRIATDEGVENYKLIRQQ